MGKSKLGLFSVLLVISVLWKPAYTNECSTACKGNPANPGFAANTKYNYGVEGTVNIFLTGASDKETSVKLLGQVSVTALGNCGHELTVQNLVISGPDGKKYQSPPGIDKPVRFSLQDGRLAAEICTVQGDTRRSLNIKRAIISLLQTEQKSTTQVDIFGACPTEIAYSAEGGATLVHRTRDLARCAHREQGKNDLIASVLNENAEIKESQVLQSTLHVESKVNNGIPEKVSAAEEYLYKPFSVGENGARARVHTKLVLTGKAGGAAAASQCTIPRSVIFEAPHGAPLQDNVNSALAAVKDTAKAINNEASEKSAGNFAALIRIFRVTSKDDLIKVWNQVKGNNFEKRVYLDALLRTGTGASIEASIQILKSHGLNELEQQLVYLSLGNAKHVNDEALKAATGLLDQHNLPKEIYLGVGALAGAYCRSHQCHTTKSDGIVALSQKLGAKLQNCKPKTKIDEDNVVAVLKGIRSIRHLEDSLIEKLVHCVNDHNVKARVKASALEAFGADPCSAKLKKTALDIMKNRQLDSEIRIKGYLAVIACPCARSANEIKSLLDSEPVHQVGRYITSSLRAIRASSSPDRQLARQHYALISTPNKFNVDDRKYSFYRESSFNVDALGVGGAVEQSVIYSQNSFLPRSASLNLTTEIFGHSFNILELGGRQGNLDLVVEHFLGPKGILKTKGPQAIYDILSQAFAQSSEKVKSALNRGRRSIKTEIDGFDKSLKAEELHFDNELDLDIYVKLFGTDAVFLSLGDDKGFDYNKVLDKIMSAITGGIGKAQHMSTELRTHLLFLDAELAYPTSIGVPLRLDLTGAATARIDLSTNFDLKQCISNPQNAKIDIKFIPSSDIEITGTLIVDADAIATGLKVVTNLHSSTGGHLVAKVLENGNGIDLQLGLPVEKQEIIVASNDLVYITVEKGQKEKQIKINLDGEKKEYAGCFDQLSGLLGMTLCGQLTLPFSVSGPEAQASISKYLARFPLSGQSQLKLVLEKNDLKGYHVRGLVKSENGKATLDLLFEAEGSKNRRTQIIAERIYTNTEVGVKLSLNSPIKNMAGEISLRNSPSELIAMAKANVDNDQYYGRVGFNVAGNEQRMTYKPIFEYQLPGDQKHTVQIDGHVLKSVNGPNIKYQFEGISIKLPSSQEPIAVQGFYAYQTNARNVQWNLISDFTTIKGSLKNSDIELEFFNKLNPLVNFILKGHSEFGDVIKNEFDVIYSGDCKDQSRRLIFGQFLKYQKSEKDFNVITKNKLEIVTIPFKVSFDADLDPKKVEVEFEFKNVDQKADLELKARTQIKRPEDYSIKLNSNVNKHGIEIFSKRDVINNDKSNLQNYIVVKGVGRYELSGVVLHRTLPNDINVGAVGHLKISGKKNEDIKFDIGATQTTTLYSSHAKVSSSQGELVDYLLKINTADNANGQLKFNLKDAISANGQFQVTDANGKGNGVLIVDFKKSQRKIKGDVKFQAKKPVFNGDFDIYLNWEKDNKDKISFSTNTKQTDKSLDSKNKLEYGGKNTEVNVNLNGELAVSGKSHANVEVVLPTERCLTLKYNRDVNEKSNVYNGNINLQLSDAPKRGAGASSISYTGKVVNTNVNEAIIDYAGELVFKLMDGKQLKNTFSLKNQPQGNEKFKLDFKNEVTGNVLPKPASVDLSYTYLDSLTAEDDVYRLKAAYGDDTSVDLTGTWIIKFPEKGEKKYLDDFTANVRLPFEKAHDIKWVSTVLYLLPENKEVAEYTIIESVQVNADVWKVDANGKVGVRQGSGTVKVLVPHVDPVILDASYKTEDSHDKKALFTEVKAKYGKGKSATFSVDTSGTANGNSVSIKANAPHLEKMKKLEISVNSKHPAPDTYSSSWIIDADGRVYKSESSIVLSKAHPILDLKYTSPTNGKTSRIYVKGSSLSSTQGKIEVKIDNVRDISLEAISEASVQKDNVNFKVQANSKELGWDNFIGEITSKDSGNGKRLEFQSTNGNKNVLSGSTSFISKQEGQKTIIEGSGSVKIKEEQKSANFKYIRTILTEGNEKGVETFFNVAFGERSYVAESRVTNLEYKNSHVYCEEKKQCANAELQSKIDVSKPGVIANVVSAGLDLRILGITPELGLIVRDEVSTSRLPQYTLDLHANKDSRKYHLHVYSTPEFGHSKAGVKIQLPSRVMVLEQSVAYPTDKPLPFPIKGELVLDLNKNKPGHKAAARFLVDLEVGNSEKQTAVAEFGFSHPKIDKEALIRISGAAVRHGDNNFKVETTAKISHASLGKDRESKILLEVSPTHLVFVINTPIVKIIDVTASAAFKDKLQKADIKFVLLDNKPVQAEFLIKDFQYYEFTSAAPDRKLSVIGHIDPEKRVDITADIVLGGQKKNLAHGALWLENNQVKSDYGANKDNCNYFYKALRKDLDDLEGRVKELGEKAGKDLKDVSRRVQPTLHKLEQAYEEDLKKIYQEIADDKVLKDISEAFHNIAKYVAKIIDEVVTGTKPIIDNITALVSDLAKKIQELYEKQIEPSIKQFYATIADGIKTYLDSVIDVVAHFAAFVTDFFEKHKAELQELTNTIAEIFKDITRLIVAELKEYRAKVGQIFNDFTAWLKDLPILQVIKEKWAELAVPEQALGFAQQAHDTIRPLLPTPEAQAFADALNDYVLKKLRKDKMDDSKELRVVYQKLVNAVASLIQYVRAQLNQYGVVPTGPQVTSWWNWNPVNTGSAPTFGGSASFSALKQFLTGDFPDVSAIVNAYRPRSLDPLQQVPSPLRAVVVNGQHIFTFDGRHLTFPGSCRYVLAHDYVDRNFTLLLQMADGKPKALVLEDKNGAVIELKENGQVTLNGANHGFPVEEKDSFAFRQANGRIGLGTLYGLMAFCSPKLEVCYFEVNGFYLGKLRGLLGDGNNEPYDDFRLPNGKISASESEFGNAYRLARSCPQVQVPEHSHHQLHHAPLPADCDKVFGGSSPLRALSLVLDIAPFRQACIHAVAGAAAPLRQACDLGAGYAALAVSGLLPAVMPDVCMSCTDADKPRSIEDTYEFKLPNKQADIVIAVETTKVNEKTFKELVVPLVSQVIDQLKSKRCTDVKVYLVGITSRFPYPLMYDTDLKLKNAKITFTDESRYDYITPIKTGGEKVDKAIDQFVSILNGLKTHFGIMTIEASYAQLYEIPLRPGAVKHSIMVVGEHCKPANILLEAFSAAIHDSIRENNAISHSLISITDGLIIGNGKNAQQVVGFNKNAVLMLGDKKPSKDAEALRATLAVSPDSCIDFVEEVEGTVYSSTNFFALNAGQQKQFLQTVSGAIGHAMLHETLIQECICTYSDPFSARSVCINKDRKEIARRRK